MAGPVLDTVIGLVFVFFLVSLAASALVEVVANWLRKRAKYLLRGLRDLLDTPTEAQSALTMPPVGALLSERALYKRALRAGTPQAVPPTAGTLATPWTDDLMAHPLVRPFKQSRASGGQTRNPSYLPAKTFVAALLDLVVPNAAGDTSLPVIRANVDAMTPTAPFRQALLGVLKTAGNDLDVFRASLENWYDSSMERISGAYKRWAKRLTILFAIGVVLGLQIDSIAIARTLYVDEPVRAAVVAAATNDTLCNSQDNPKDADSTRACVNAELTRLGKAGLPVGWGGRGAWPGDWPDRWLRILGWSITVGAAAFGAPFWYDQLNRLGSLRNTGTKPKSTS